MNHEADYAAPADRPPYQELGSQTMLNLDALRTEIQTDPEHLGYAQATACAPPGAGGVMFSADKMATRSEATA